MADFNSLTVDQIRQCLENHSEPVIDQAVANRDSQYAAVLIPFFRFKEQWHLLFIRRAVHKQDPHSGQIAFAGGKYEDYDANLKATALREAQEEIGLAPDDVTLLGELNEYHSISHFRITPVVSFIPWPYEFTLDKKEVARTLMIPLNWLANPENYSIKPYQSEKNKTFEVIYFNEYDGEVLWGVTARMTLSLISLLRSAIPGL